MLFIIRTKNQRQSFGALNALLYRPSVPRKDRGTRVEVVPRGQVGHLLRKVRVESSCLSHDAGMPTGGKSGCLVRIPVLVTPQITASQVHTHVKYILLQNLRNSLNFLFRTICSILVLEEYKFSMHLQELQSIQQQHILC